VLHLLRGEELRLLDVDHCTGLGHGHHQVGLPRQEGRQLDDVADFGHWCGLVGFMHIGNHRHAEGLLHFLEDLHALFQARATERGNGRAVGLVEAGLEHIGDAEFLGDPHVFLAGAQRQVARLDDVDTAEQHEWLVVGNVDIANANGLLTHA